MTRTDKAFAFFCGLVLAACLVFGALSAYGQPVNTCCIPQSDKTTLTRLDAGLKAVESRLNATRGDAGTIIIAYSDGGIGPLQSSSESTLRLATNGTFTYLTFTRPAYAPGYDLASGSTGGVTSLIGGNSGDLDFKSAGGARFYMTGTFMQPTGQLIPVTNAVSTPPYSGNGSNTSGIYFPVTGQAGNSYTGTAQGRLGQNVTHHECIPLASACANTTDFQPAWSVPEGMAGAGSALIDCAIETAGTGSGTQSLIVWDSTVGADAGSAVVAVTASCTTTGNVAGVTQSTLNLLAGRQVTLRWNKGACTTAGAGIRCTVRWK